MCVCVCVCVCDLRIAYTRNWQSQNASDYVYGIET